MLEETVETQTFNFTLANQMELNRTTLIFLVLIVLAFIGTVFVSKESFVDASGTMVQVSLTDLLKLFTTTSSMTTAPDSVSPSPSYDSLRKDIEKTQKDSMLSVTGTTDTTTTISSASPYDSAFKSELLKEVRASVRDELQKKQEGSVLSDSCIDSVANQQGTDWMRYIPGKNPADYIRKDSIPCYGCNLK